MSVDVVNSKEKAKVDINWDYLIRDAERQINKANLRITKLKDCITFFKEQRNPKVRTAAQN